MIISHCNMQISFSHTRNRQPVRFKYPNVEHILILYVYCIGPILKANLRQRNSRRKHNKVEAKRAGLTSCNSLYIYVLGRRYCYLEENNPRRDKYRRLHHPIDLYKKYRICICDLESRCFCVSVIVFQFET